MILPIYLYGSPILRKKSVDIDKNYPNIKELIDNMFETMYKSDGLGLAAPQVGLNINMFIIDAKPLAEDYPELAEFKRVFINPEITFNTEETEALEEGCLSIPSIHETVNRPNDLTIKYLNENFEEVTETLKSYPATIIQHEFDHLKGIMFVDKISPLRKRFIKTKLQNISKGKVGTSYRVKK